MPPFRSFARTLRPLALLGRRARQAAAPRAVGREIELYRGPPGAAADLTGRGRCGTAGGTVSPATEASGRGQRWAGAGRGLFGLGAGGLVVAAVLSFGVVLGGATVLSVVRGGPMISPADQRSAPAREARAGPGPDGTATIGPAPTGAAPASSGAGGPGAPRGLVGPSAGGGAFGSARGDGSAGGSGGSEATAAAARAELPGRIQEILQVREEAFARRDAGLLAVIYTEDCACLRSGRAAIAQLRADHVVWRGRAVSVRVERLSRVKGSLWIALALLRRSAFRIEAENGDLISAEPAVRQRYRFALARSPAGTWLLGHASLVEELPP
jgi:hypothetical protein